MPSSVLDVGQCGFDHGAIQRLLSSKFDAQVVRAHTLADALNCVRERGYDLVLVNRVLDSDGGDGLEVIEAIKRDPATSATRVMLVSNHADAQEKATAAGAEPGFGKNSLHTPATAQLLGKYLSQK